VSLLVSRINRKIGPRHFLVAAMAQRLGIETQVAA
jgi:hypothetical protein